MKLKEISLFTLASVFFLFFISCFHKSVTKGEADDVRKAMIRKLVGNDYLVVSETVFQATSKKSSGGSTSITGYEDLRLSVYDLKNGELVARKHTGRNKKGKVSRLLGCSNDKIWMYANNDDLGLHALHPKSLDIALTRKQILKSKPELINNLAKPELHTIDDFYFYDELNNNLIVTDNQGKRYTVNPESLQVSELPGNYKIPWIAGEPNYMSRGVEFRLNKRLYLEGDLQKQIEYDDYILLPDREFLDGYFLIHNDQGQIYKSLQAKIEPYMIKKMKLKKVMDSLEQKYGEQPSRGIPDGKLYWEKHAKHDKIYRSLISFQSKMKKLQEGRISMISQIMQPDTNSFFVVHKNNITDTAKVQISFFRFENHDSLTGQWTTTLPGIYFDYNAAAETNVFKSTFSKGNPDFSFHFFGLTEDKLVAIYMLHTFALDLKSGELLWKSKL